MTLTGKSPGHSQVFWTQTDPVKLEHSSLVMHDIIKVGASVAEKKKIIQF